MSMIRRRRAILPAVAGISARIAARSLARLAARRATTNSRPNQTRARSTNNGGDNPLTTQHDYKVDYRRRPRTRRLKRRIRRGKKFTRRVVNSYLRATTSPKKVVKLAMFTRVSQANTSNFFATCLNTADGVFTGDNPQADWREFFREGSPQNARGWDDSGNPNAPLVYPNISERGRAIRCIASAMELTIRNTGAGPALVNVYRIVCRRDYPFSNVGIEDIYQEGFRRAGRVTEIDQPVEAGTPWGMWDSQMTPGDLTSTPFASFLFTRCFTIYRRTKYQLSPGEEINLVLRNNRPKTISMDRVRGKCVVAGLTHGYFVDFQGVPVHAEGSAGVSSAQLTVQKMVRYNLVMMPEKRPATSFDTQDVT